MPDGDGLRRAHRDRQRAQVRLRDRSRDTLGHARLARTRRGTTGRGRSRSRPTARATSCSSPTARVLQVRHRRDRPARRARHPVVVGADDARSIAVMPDGAGLPGARLARRGVEVRHRHAGRGRRREHAVLRRRRRARHRDRLRLRPGLRLLRARRLGRVLGTGGRSRRGEPARRRCSPTAGAASRSRRQAVRCCATTAATA